MTTEFGGRTMRKAITVIVAAAVTAALSVVVAAVVQPDATAIEYGL